MEWGGFFLVLEGFGRELERRLNNEELTLIVRAADRRTRKPALAGLWRIIVATW